MAGLDEEKRKRFEATMTTRMEAQASREPKKYEGQRIMTSKNKRRAGKKISIKGAVTIGALGLAAVIGASTVIASGENKNNKEEHVYASNLMIDEEISKDCIQLDAEEREEFIQFAAAVQRLNKGGQIECERYDDECKVKKYAEKGALKEVTAKIVAQEIERLVEADGAVLRSNVSFGYGNEKNEGMVSVKGEVWHGSIEEDTNFTISRLPDFMNELVLYVINEDSSEHTLEESMKIAENLLKVMFNNTLVYTDYHTIEVIKSQEKYDEIMKYKEAKHENIWSSVNKNAFYDKYQEGIKGEMEELGLDR